MSFHKLQMLKRHPLIQGGVLRIRDADGTFGFWMACIFAGVFAGMFIGFGPFPNGDVIPPPPQRPAEISPEFNLAAHLVPNGGKESPLASGNFASLSQPAAWRPGKNFNLEKEIARIDTPFVYKHDAPKARASERFSVELYRLAATPETHLHFRQVDYNELGYGGGFKIALEIVEKF